jgi:phosphoribosylamine--glycine ligase
MKGQSSLDGKKERQRLWIPVFCDMKGQSSLDGKKERQVSEINVLLIGSGGREHALAWKLAASPIIGGLYAAPGNPGIARHATCVPLDTADHAAVIAFSREKSIGLVVVGPEIPLVEGLVDDLTAAGISAFGPSRAAAQLEGSKGYTKALCAARGIPTAAYVQVRSCAEGLDHVRRRGAPIVVKADGLAAGKGVTVAMSVREAEAAIEAIFNAAPGNSSAVIEDYLEGEEASFFALVDGRHVLPLSTAQDHKRAFDGDVGPNTGGMGAYSPAPVMTQALIDQTMQHIIQPTVNAMNELGTPFIGVLYAGLMITAEGPKLIEYNVRFGDPECQVLMMRLKDDLLAVLMACAAGTLDKMSLRWHDDAALTIVMASKGYPGEFTRGSVIRGLETGAALEKVEIFHAGTAERNGAIIANGGRVLNVSARGRSVGEAQALAYRAAALIDWPEGFYRRDIGQRAVERERLLALETDSPSMPA